MSQNNEHFLCNAGYNVASALPDGTVNYCLNKKIRLGNIYTGFQFKDDLTPCQASFCDCPLYSFEKRLHDKALGKEITKKTGHTAFIHWHVTYSCNMMCHYCILCIGDPKEDLINKRSKPNSIKINKMIYVLEKTGHKFLISFIGGEPFLVPNINEACAALTKEKHRVMFNTNLTLIKPDFFEMVDMNYLGCFHISCHLLPMEKRRLTQTFIKNVNMMQDTGHKNYYVTVVAEPDIFPKLDYYKDLFAKHNIYFELIPMLDGGGVNGKVYPESYTDDQLELINKEWLCDYFPDKYAKNEVADLKDYTFPILNTDKRG